MNTVFRYFAQCVEKTAIEMPDHTAVVEADRRVISYRELNEMANRFAGWIREEAGCKKGDRVAVYLDNRAEFLAVILACSKIGTIFTAYNIMSVDDAVRKCDSQCGSRVVFTEKELYERLCGILPEDTDRIVNVDSPVFRDRSAGYSGENVCGSPDPDADFMILHTSGTTGDPKGAVYTQRQALTSVDNWVRVLETGCFDRRLITQKFCFAGGLMAMVMPMLYVGGALYLMRKFNAQAALQMVVADKITLTGSSSTVCARMAMLPEFEKSDISSLRRVEIGGGYIPPEAMEPYRRRGIRIIPAFGMTETCGSFAAKTPFSEDPFAYRPFPGNQVRIVDEDGYDLPPGTAGEILIKGPAIFKGYWNNPGGTQKAFTDGWFHTGDLGSLNENGDFRISGRKKDLIITGALNVPASDVNKILLSHPDIDNSAVFGLPHPDWGEAVTAAVVPVKGSAVTEEELIHFCRERISGYMTPKRILILDELPLNAGQKVITPALKEKYRKLYFQS